LSKPPDLREEDVPAVAADLLLLGWIATAAIDRCQLSF